MGIFTFSADTAPDNIETNIPTGNHAVESIDTMILEAKHLVAPMLSSESLSRPSLTYVEKHTLFWPLKAKVKFIGEEVGSVLLVRIHKSKNDFIMELEVFDRELGGAYDKSHPDAGGSWAQCLDSRYPLI